jgi:putative chitobiose transport system permease protein
MRRRGPAFVIRRILYYLLLTVGAAVFLFPFLLLLSTALKSPGQSVFGFPPDLIPKPPSLHFIQLAWNTIPFPRYLTISAMLVVVTIPLYLLVTLLAAYPLARMRFRFKQLFFYLILSTMFLPGEVLLVPRFLVVSRLHLADTFAALILPGLIGAFGTILLRRAFEGIPMELEDAARLDGANEWQIFAKVMLPQVRAALATLSIFSFVSVWNSFLWPLVVLKDPDKYPVALGLAYLSRIGGTDIRTVAAGTVITVIPIVIFFISTQKYFVEGMKGAIK